MNDILFEITGVDQVVGNFDLFVKKNSQVLAQSINQIVLKASTASTKEAKAEWKGLRVKDFKDPKVLHIRKATTANLESIWTLKTKPIPLSKFSTKYKTARTGTGRKTRGGAGVTYKLKSNRRQLGNSSFLKKSKFNNGRVEVFTRRKSPNGASITAHSAITQSSMFKQVDGFEIFKDVFFKQFPQRYKNKLRQTTHL